MDKGRITGRALATAIVAAAVSSAQAAPAEVAIPGEKVFPESLTSTSDGTLYGFKYVNGHPYNTRTGRQTVTAFGVLADTASGYPTLITEMTILTALRTIAISGSSSIRSTRLPASGFRVPPSSERAVLSGALSRARSGVAARTKLSATCRPSERQSNSALPLRSPESVASTSAVPKRHRRRPSR